jgi:predicted aldo/keto reductase-like oxidoreductase
MQYRNDSNGKPLSILGYGCMRFSRSGGKIDLEKAEKEVLLAIEKGVNYFDTAYMYPGSEAALGEILARNKCRDKVSIATKLPLFRIRSLEGIEKTFNESLKRLQTDHVDYYLMHMMNDVATWEYLVSLGITDWIAEKKKSGQIRRIGFSFHGNSENFSRLIDAYDWEFCQIQYNYLDENSQAGTKGLKYAASKGLHVIVMGPLRGGRLADQLPKKALELIAKDEKKRTATDLAFLWLWNQPEVTCVLSGMNSLQMVEENTKAADAAQAGSFDDYGQQLIADVRAEIMHSTKVLCTGCGYCMPCPQGVDIPLAFQCYNMLYSNKKGIKQEYMQATALRKEQISIAKCTSCGQCESHCPQTLEIRKELKNAASQLEGFTFKLASWAVKVLKIY